MVGSIIIGMYGGVRVDHLINFLCFVVLLSFVCLRPVSCDFIKTNSRYECYQFLLPKKFWQKL
jgi:hypothetical protein